MPKPTTPAPTPDDGYVEMGGYLVQVLLPDAPLTRTEKLELGFIEMSRNPKKLGAPLPALNGPVSEHKPVREGAPSQEGKLVCTGVCGEEKPVKKFPTTSGGKRGTECRDCRDKRRDEKKAQKDVADRAAERKRLGVD